MRGRKRGTVASGGAQEDVGRAIEDIVNHNDWRAGTKKAVFMLGDEAFEGGDPFDQADVDDANTAIAVANAADARVHTYFAKGDPKFAASNKAEFARVAAETGGQAYTYEDTLEAAFRRCSRASSARARRQRRRSRTARAARSAWSARSRRARSRRRAHGWRCRGHPRHRLPRCA